MSSSQPARVKKPLFTDGFREDPYPTYGRFLGEQRIHYVDWGPGIWAIFNYSDCSSALKDPRLSAKRTGVPLLSLAPEKRGEFTELARTLGLWMLFMDAPEHSRLRKLMNKGFSPSGMESLRSQIEGIVDRMIEPLRHTSEGDLMHEIAHPMPVRVIAELLGIPDSMQTQLVQWSDSIAMFFGNPRRTLEDIVAAQRAVIALTDYFRAEVARRRLQKGSDLISLLLEIEEDGEVLTEEELHAQCVMLLFGGHETTRNLIGNGMYALLTHPEKLSELRARPDIIRSAVEELLRYESPVQFTGRIAREEMDLWGERVLPGEMIAIMLGAANRDPKQFEDAGTLNLDRRNNAHLAFGAGAHFCIGNQLARLEGQTAILRLSQVFPRIQLSGQRPEWSPNIGLRGLHSLPVNL